MLDDNDDDYAYRRGQNKDSTNEASGGADARGTGFRIHCPMAFSPCCVPVQSINDDTKAAAYPVGKNKDSTDEAAVETVQDDTTAVAYLVGKSKDSTDEASAESMKNDTTALPRWQEQGLKE